MANVVICFTQQCSVQFVPSMDILKNTIASITGLPPSDYYVVTNGRLLSASSSLHDGQKYHVFPRVLGGKGGFGSMLRAIGAQIEKTTNREACRDLSGRRVRDVNNEKRLREWVAKASDREKAKAERRQERREKFLARPRHTFNDPEYEKQKTKVSENLDEALLQGLQKSTAGTSAAGAGECSSGVRKRKHIAETITDPKKAKDWLGIDLADLSDDSSSTGSNTADLETTGTTDLTGAPTSVCLPASTSAASFSFISGDGSSMQDEAFSAMATCNTTNTDDVTDVDHCSSGLQMDGVSDDDSSSEVSYEHDTSSSVDTDGMNGSMCVGQNTDVNGIHMSRQNTDVNDIHMSRQNTDVQPEDGMDKDMPRLVDEAVAPSQDKPTDVKTTETTDNSVDDIDLSDVDSVSELESLGLDTLKLVLMRRGLKCGGTLRQRAERLFAVKGLREDQIDPTLLARPAKKT